MHKSRASVVLSLAAVASVPLALSLVASARAANVSWSSPTSGTWTSFSNWSTGTVPTSADAVSIAAPGGPYTVTAGEMINSTAATGPLTLNNPNATLLLDAPYYGAVHLATAGDINIAAGTLALHNNYHSNITVGPASSAAPVNFTNAGRIDHTMDQPVLFYSSATFQNLSNASNSGTIEVHDGPTGLPDALLQFKAANAFTNTGTLRSGAHSRVEIYAPAFNQNAGSIDGTVSFTGANFNYNGGSVGTVLFPDTSTLNLGPAAVTGTFVATRSLNLSRGLSPDQTLYIDSRSSSPCTLSIATLTNTGHIVIGANPSLPGSVHAASVSLLHPTDTLTNTGTLDINSPLTSPSDPCTLTGNVINSGAVHISTPITAGAALPTFLDGNWTNNGSLAVAAGSYTYLSRGSSFTQNPGASLSVASEPLTLTNAHFYFNGGSVAGNVALNNSTVHFAPGLSAASGTFTYSTAGSNGGAPATPFTGDIPTGATLVHGPGTGGLYSLPSFVNAGSLLTGGSSPVYRLNNYTGTLTNTGTLSGSFKIDGNLVNTGTVKSTYLTLAGSTSATIPTPSFDQNTGTLDVDTSCTITHATFNYNGGTLTGKPVDLNASTLNIAPGTNPASFTFYLGDNTLHGTPAPGSTLSLDSVVIPPLSVPKVVTVTADPFTNAGTLSFAATATLITSTLTITGSGTLTNTGTLSVTQGKGGTRTLNAHVLNTGTLSIGPNATLTLNGSLSTTTPLDLQGTLDLRGGPLTWSYAPGDPSPADTLRSLLATAHLTDTTADPSHRLAYSFSAEPTAPPSLLVTLALTGDTNLDGIINPDDYALLDRAYARSLTNAHWTDGDFNYDGAIDQNDYFLIDVTYLQQQGGIPSPSFLSQRESQFGPAYVSTLLASVPEPTSLFAACGLALLLPRGHRRT